MCGRGVVGVWVGGGCGGGRQAFVGDEVWRKGAFFSVCIFHNQKMHVYLISYWIVERMKIKNKKRPGLANLNIGSCRYLQNQQN